MENFKENPFSHWMKPFSPPFNKVCYKIFSESGLHKLNSLVTTIKQIYGYNDCVTKNLTKFLKKIICEHFGVFALLIDEFHEQKVHNFLFNLKEMNYVKLYIYNRDIINYLGELFS